VIQHFPEIEQKQGRPPLASATIRFDPW